MQEVRPHEPNTTSVPNVFLDYWMAHLDNLEFKVLMFITRKTMGWHKKKDRISVKQICEGVGKSERPVSRAIARLMEFKLIKKMMSKAKDGDNNPNTFEINLIPIPKEGFTRPKKESKKAQNTGGKPDGRGGGAGDGRGGALATPTKETMTKAKSLKGIDYTDGQEVIEKSLPFSSGKRVIEEADDDTPKYPLKKEQQPILAALREIMPFEKPSVLYIMIRSDHKNNPEHFMKCIQHVKNEILKGTYFSKGATAFFRDALKNQSLVTDVALENKRRAEEFARAVGWQNLRITDKYVLCEVTQKEVPTNFSPDIFRECLMELYELSKIYSEG